MRLRIRTIRLDFQPPENLDEETVMEYLAVLKRDGALPQVRVRFDGTDYFLEDGFHRVEATRRAGRKMIDAEVLPGTLEQMEADWREVIKQVNASLKRDRLRAKSQKK